MERFMCGTEQLWRCLFLAVLLAAGPLACVEHALHEKVWPTQYDVAARPPPAPPTDGAIWRGDTASGSFLFFDRKARGVGDLVTVLVAENASAMESANTSLEKESSLGAKLTSDIGFTDLLQEAAESFFDLLGIDVTGTKATSGEEVNVIESTQTSGFEGDGETRRRGTFSSIVTCRVVEVLPGDIFHIYGRRELVVNHELQLITVDGLVRREDISIHNTVPSTVLAEARLTYDGIGVIDDKQRPSLIARLFDWVYPF
jgi:flagellar L-ring protein precursor FlgH